MLSFNHPTSNIHLIKSAVLARWTTAGGKEREKAAEASLREKSPARPWPQQGDGAQHPPRGRGRRRGVRAPGCSQRRLSCRRGALSAPGPAPRGRLSPAAAVGGYSGLGGLARPALVRPTRSNPPPFAAPGTETPRGHQRRTDPPNQGRAGRSSRGASPQRRLPGG